MRYKQRHITIKATPHNQNEYVVGDMCRIDNVRSVCGKDSAGHMIVKNRQVGLPLYMLGVRYREDEVGRH